MTHEPPAFVGLPTEPPPKPLHPERSVTPPRDWAHHVASLGERVTRLEARVGITSTEAHVEAHKPVERPALGLTEDVAAPREVPPGVVPPHVRDNLDALAVWTDPALWTLAGTPEEKLRTEAMLAHLHGLVMTAMAGEDVPRPGA